MDKSDWLRPLSEYAILGGVAYMFIKYSLFAFFTQRWLTSVDMFYSYVYLQIYSILPVSLC